jgi:hypothetical protein
MFSIFNAIGNDTPDYWPDETGYKKPKLQVPPPHESHRPVNRELSGGWTAATHHAAETKTDDSVSIFDEIGRF